ncbi:MAG: hypothetical protein KDA27_11825 [Candidatus Eisenbacteria bacterium]|uniref:Nucleotidyltransferase family protein n=1 Tax=Eiseniibacteriota bacterium TaxID=2212470 RepID=A0A956NC72_UNCEI|nr:hypothetical protein [Candidatus Eisenbacteria bacterium]
MDIIEELRSVVGKLDAGRVDYALCGGLAMAVYAMPRATLDIDLMIQTASLDEAARAIEPLGFAESGDPMDFKGGAVQIRRFCKVDSQSAESLILDFLLVTEETNTAWESRQDVDWNAGTLRVISPEGLILLKQLRGSGVDQDDIAYLRRLADED